MKIFKTLIVLVTLATFGVGVAFAQTKTSTQLDNLVKAGIQEQKTNPQTAVADKEVTTGEVQSAGENKVSGSVGSGSKDVKEIQVPEVNVEKEVETESKSSNTDTNSKDSSTKSSTNK